MDQNIHASSKRADLGSRWRRFIEAAKRVAKHISPMDGPRVPFSDEPRAR
jgi:hypothetical protein